MFKKLLSLVLAVFILGMTAVGFASCSKDKEDAKNMKFGIILVGDENEGYTAAHIDGIKAAMKKLNIADDQVIWKYTVTEDEKCFEAAEDLVGKGCKVIFSNSYGHQTYMEQAAKQFTDVHFVAATGDTAAKSGLSNFSNAFTNVYESRYVSGIVAGLKVKELVEAGKLTDANKDANGKVKIGYVGAYPYAEVVSGYTAFFLGIQSVYADVSMEVTYTNKWFDITKENEAAKMLVNRGCVIIGQHADSTGAPTAVQELNKAGKVCYSVGYNVDMLNVAKDAALTSATNNWGAYYEYAMDAALKGEKIVTDWAKGYADGAVAITDLGSSCAEGTQAAVDKAIADIKAGTLKVFDVSKFTVSAESPAYTVDADKHIVTAFATDTDGDFVNDKDNVVENGYFSESTLRSAPYFSIRIDGITELVDSGN